MDGRRTGADGRADGLGAPGLEERIELVLAEAMDELGHPSGAGERRLEATANEPLMELALELLVEQLVAECAGSAERSARIARLIATLERSLRELRALADRQRVDALAAVHAGIDRLRGATSRERLIAAAPAEAGRSCGFDRVLCFRLDGGDLHLEAAHLEHTPEQAEALLERLREERLPLSSELVEAEALRRRAPMLVARAERSGISPALDELHRTGSFVVAPVLCEGQVVGLLEADRASSQRDLARLDRDALWAFAVGFGQALERLVLAERLRAQGDEIRRLARAADVLADGLDGTQPPAGADGPGLGQAAARLLSFRSEDEESQLSPREAQVLAAMASGATNSEIAAQLYIAEETVKTHVKQILRKLGATNRVQAVVLALQATARADTVAD